MKYLITSLLIRHLELFLPSKQCYILIHVIFIYLCVMNQGYIHFTNIIYR